MSFSHALLPAGALAGVLAAQQPTTLDWVPSLPDTVLDTQRAPMVATNGTPVDAVDGLFRFRNVTIPAGFRVRGVGPHPMIWIVDTITVAGELSVSGEDGQRVNTLGSVEFPAHGGRGGAAGGDGGDGSPQIGMRSFAGMAGAGPGNAPGRGGYGGALARGNSGPGSGGGGGAFATAGDPHYKDLHVPGTTSFVQQLGFGGYGNFGASGTASRALPGGAPGGIPFADADASNDFFGFAYDVHAARFVVGELPALTGGSGGGGGGDGSWSTGFSLTDLLTDTKGGGGGGGGGCLVVVAQNRIQVVGSGRITANGGRGGGGEQAGSCNAAGGGGGGSGGLVILAASTEIVIDVHAETYANNDYDFAVSADGGVCRTGGFLSPDIQHKYSQFGTTGQVVQGSQYDARPLGGFGGLGIVEMVTRPGTNQDGTNTVLDDNIRLMRNGVPLTGAQKQRYLAWRGFPDAQGVPVDDFGAPTNIGANEGDIRPAPVLIPWL